MKKNKDKGVVVAKMLKLDDVLRSSGEPMREAVVSGQVEIGKNGNPVSIIVEDEITGEAVEFSGVKNALIMIEEKRRSSSGWLSLVIGDEKKIKEVVKFLSCITLDGLKKKWMS